MQSKQQVVKLRLQTELDKKIESNSSYSMRAFARDLGVNPSTISRLLSDKTRASEALLDKLIKLLKLSNEETSKLLSHEMDPFIDLSSDEEYIQLIMNWENSAICSLIETVDFSYEHSWIANRLGITEEKASECLEFLFRTGLIEETAENSLAVKDIAITTKQPASLKGKPDKLLIQKTNAMEKSLHDTSDIMKELSDITTITMAIDTKKIPEAKERLKKFRRDFSKYLDEGKKDEVYVMLFGLFPISKLK